MKVDFLKSRPQSMMLSHQLNKRNLPKYLESHTWFLSKLDSLSGKTGIDVGCGDGFFLGYLKKQFGLARIVGLDIDPVRCRIARKLNPEIKIVEANAERIPFKNKSFDFVFVNSVLHHVKNNYRVIDELIRICKNNGLIAIVEPKRFHPAILLLSLWKLEERGQLGLSLKKVWQFLKQKKAAREVQLFPVNSFIYPYQKFPPLILFKIISKLEDFFNCPYLSTHQAIVVKVKK